MKPFEWAGISIPPAGAGLKIQSFMYAAYQILQLDRGKWRTLGTGRWILMKKLNMAAASVATDAEILTSPTNPCRISITVVLFVIRNRQRFFFASFHIFDF